MLATFRSGATGTPGVALALFERVSTTFAVGALYLTTVSAVFIGIHDLSKLPVVPE
ncbi:hypothetical protein FRACA_1920007 [Frankia canadensis]|uniref:Uncharacterized protein n=1 Tax=Frankia canadensis TaxID=1836972 RepID=A0A2I2KPC0_9ACTN|nr:hypothetical protein FRACA_1920007 [Frankia canadensis]SOU54801.1 hypothetical protein FRACA_1920007 [Frankia canadensis]